MFTRNADDYFDQWTGQRNIYFIGNQGGADASCAIRFPNVTIPQGTQIQSATLGVYVGSQSGSGDIKARIRGIDEDNTGDFSSSPMSRNETTAEDVADWSVPPSGEFSNHGVTAIVQEIINRSGWQSGNAMGFKILNNGSPTDRYIFDIIGFEPNSKLEIVLSSPSASPSRSPSRSVSKSPSPTPSASISPSPSPSPEIPPSNHGLKISKEGYDVKKSSVFEDVFNSSKGVLGKRSTTTFQATTDAGFIDDGKATGLEYIPLVFCTVTCRDGTVINVPGTHESDWDAFEILVEEFKVRLSDGFITFSVHAYHYEPIQGGTTTELDNQTYTFNILYCFNELSIEQ